MIHRTHKKCRRCDEVKMLSEFYKVSGCKDGTRNVCKKCHNAALVLSQSRNLDKLRTYHHNYYLQNVHKWVKRTAEQQDKYNEVRRREYAQNEKVREKAKVDSKKWQDSNPEKRKAQRLIKFGITLDEFNLLMDSQDNKCAICGYSDLSRKQFFPIVDHCHKGGKVRGILCSNCNFGLGSFKDNPAFLMKAASYLTDRG